MADWEVDLLGYYYLMLIGAIGIIAILIYVIAKILLHIRRKAKENVREN